jgi:hypothetical protein
VFVYGRICSLSAPSLANGPSAVTAGSWLALALLPAGVLPQMSGSLRVPEARAGLLVTAIRGTVCADGRACRPKIAGTRRPSFLAKGMCD